MLCVIKVTLLLADVSGFISFSVKSDVNLSFQSSCYVVEQVLALTLPKANTDKQRPILRLSFRLRKKKRERPSIGCDFLLMRLF